MISFALLACLLVAFAPPGAALHGNTEPSVTLCGVVENAAGWPLDGIRVTAYGRGVTNADHLPRPTAVSGPDGSFSLVVLADFYRLVFEETRRPDERGGARYAPFETPVAGHDYDKGPCGATRGQDLGTVALAAPMTGFLEVPVTDAITDAPLDAADVTVRPLGLFEWGHGASTDGIARLSCPLHVPSTLRLRLDTFATEERDLTCTETLDTVPVSLWRTPVAVGGTLTDAQTDETVAAANVTVTPDTLALPPGHPYKLQDQSDANGTFTLALPWGDGYTGSAALGGYAPAGFTFTTTPADLTGGIVQDLVLVRSDGSFSGTVSDVHGAGVAAALTFTGPHPAEQQHALMSASDGTFDTTLPVGAYSLEITAPGTNTRTCRLDLPHDAAPSLDEGCLVLVSAGMGAVRGAVLDGLTLQPIGGVEVKAGGTTVATTATDGSWVAELLPGNHTLTFDADHFDTTRADVALVLDEVRTVSAVALQRETVQQSVQVADANGDPIETALVCPTFVPEDGASVPHDCGTTDASGAVMFDLQWTSRDGLFDVGDYEFDVSRFTRAPFYAETLCATAVNIDPAVSTAPIGCAAEVVPAVATDVGPLYDAHTGAPVVGATVSTMLPGEVACAYYTCTNVTDGGGSTVLHLPEGMSFDISASHGDYRSPASATGVPAGGLAFLNVTLARNAFPFMLTVRDAHTGSPLQGAEVTAVPGFTCDPTGTFTCTGLTNGDGKILLEVPHGTYGFQVAEGAYDVVLNAQFSDIEAGVRFHGAAAGPFDVPGSDDLAVSLVRQPGEPLVVNVSDFHGVPLAGARLYVASERFDGFACDPADAAPQYACRTHLDASSGALTIELPHGTAEDHTWNLTVQAPGHFREDRTGLESGSTQDVGLWPLLFDLTVDPVDVTTGETAGLVVVCILDLDEAGASPTTPPPPETCKASGVEAEPLVFENVTWRRTGPSDETDRFLVRAAGTLHFPATILAEAGPAADTVEVPLVPLDPTAPEPEASLVTGRVLDADARAIGPGDGVGVLGAQVFATATDPCPVSTFQGATGPDGTFQVPVLCHGEFTVQVVDPRYEQAPDQTVIVPHADPLAFSLDRVHQDATVRVHDATTAGPVPGADVRLMGLDVEATGSGTTGADGTVATSLPWGTYSVVVVAPADQQWLVGDATSGVALTHAGPASTDVVLVSAIAPPEPETCDEDPIPDLCEPSEAQPGIRLKTVTATDATDASEPGNWLLVPPQIGAAPIPSIGGSATPNAYMGPHAGTWTVAYAPSSLAGLSGMPTFPITFAFTYEVDGVEQVLEAQMGGPLIGPSPFASPALVWVVNLHDEASAACGGPEVSCGLPGPVDLEAAGQARFFLP